MRYDKETSAGFPTRARAGLGVIAMRTPAKVGHLVDALPIAAGDEILASTKKGMVIRCPADNVSEQGRIAGGVRLIQLEEGDEVVAVAHLAKEDQADSIKQDQLAPEPQNP